MILFFSTEDQKNETPPSGEGEGCFLLEEDLSQRLGGWQVGLLLETQGW